MDKEEFINVFILKSVLRDNRLTFLERLLLIHIISLCKKNGYCWATNRYFCDIYNVTQVTISKSISNLATFGYIKTEYDNKSTNNSKRIIKLSEVLNLKLKSIKDNFNTGYKQNFKQYNNKLNKKEDSICLIILRVSLIPRKPLNIINVKANSINSLVVLLLITCFYSLKH